MAAYMARVMVKIVEIVVDKLEEGGLKWLFNIQRR